MGWSWRQPSKPSPIMFICEICREWLDKSYCPAQRNKTKKAVPHIHLTATGWGLPQSGGIFSSIWRHGNLVEGAVMAFISHYSQ